MQDERGEMDMARSRLLKEMGELIYLSQTDEEAAHSRADDALCSMLEQHGEYTLVKAFRKVRKWYA